MWRRALVLSAAFVLIAIAAPAAATVSGVGGAIAFVTSRDGNAEIYVMDADGSNPVNLSDNDAADTDPAWSPDGRRIAFTSDRLGYDAIFVMDSDGTDQRFLAEGRGPAWSPDGGRIAYSAQTEVLDDDRTFHDIYVTDVDTAVTSRVTDASTDPGWGPDVVVGVSYSQPAWSPDGDSIAYIWSTDGPTPLAADGHAMRVIETSHPGSATPAPGHHDPDWSPQGDSILVTTGSALTQTFRLTLVDAESGATTVPVDPDLPPGQYPTAGAWNPSGDGFVIVVAEFLVPGHRIYTMAGDGSGLTLLTEDGHSPAWQPVNPYPMGLVDTARGEWHLRHPDGTVTTFFFGDPGDLPFMGDWDCDGVDTPGLYRQRDGFVYLRNSNTQGVADITFFFGNPGDLPIAGDFDGDGCDTVSVYRPAQSRVFVIDELGVNGGGLGAAETDYVFGDPGDVPFIGDFDGDGVDTVALHRASTGLVYYRNSHTQGIADHQFVFGNPGDRIVTGDWDHDGVDSPGLFRPGDRTVYLRFVNAAGPADARFIWGDADWIPVTGVFAAD